MIKKIHLLVFICSLIGFSQTPCNNGFAGSFPCNDYDLMATMSVATLANTSGNPEGSDIWGWTDSTTGKEYAIAAMTNSTAFVDVSDPLNPIFLGRLDTNAGTSFWRDVKVYNNHAFIVADNVGNHGMQVFDLTRLRNITNPPINFSADKVYRGVSSCHNIVINESKGYAYLVDCKNTGRGVHFVDISDPKNPVSMGDFNTEGVTHDAQVVTYNGPDTEHNGKEILIGSNETKVVILDVSDKNNVVKLSDITYSQLGYTHQGWFTDDMQYFILGDESDEQNFGMNTRTLVFDFSDLNNPSLSSTYFGPTRAIDHNGYVLGNTFYMANYAAGLRVLDISNIAASTNSMTEIGFFDTRPENDNTSFNGAWSVYPYFSSGNIIINDIEKGLFIVRKSGTLSVDNSELQSSLKLAPNPASNFVSISVSSSTSLTSVSVYNILGKKVEDKQNINTSKLVLDTSRFTKGIYLVKINNRFTKKLIIR